LFAFRKLRLEQLDPVQAASQTQAPFVHTPLREQSISALQEDEADAQEIHVEKKRTKHTFITLFLLIDVTKATRAGFVTLLTNLNLIIHQNVFVPFSFKGGGTDGTRVK